MKTGRNVLSSTGLRDARLLPGRLKGQQESALAYYLAIDEDSLLHGFRSRAGRQAPGRSLEGWYGAGIYHVFGQILSGLARLGIALDNSEAGAKALRLLEGWADCVEADGYGLQNPRGEVFDPWYEFDKLLGGLVDCATLLPGESAREAARAIVPSLVTWGCAALDRTPASQPYEAPPGPEWYTLSENLYRAFELTGDEAALESATVWEYSQYWDKFPEPGPFPGDLKHAYSHVNTLGAAAMAFHARGDERCLRAAIAGHDLISGSHAFATGGYGPAERLFGPTGRLGESILQPLPDGYGHVEVSCCSWAVFKLCRQLLELTGEARFADWAELVLWNLMVTEPAPAPGGRIMYYADYSIFGARKAICDGRITGEGATFEWPCCIGTYPQALAEYAGLAGFAGEKGFHVAQYLASRHRWERDGVEVGIIIETAFPEEDEVRIRVETPRALAFPLALRRPGWASRFELMVNGVAASAAMRGGWAVLDRMWQTGDTVTLRFSQVMRFVPVDEAHPGLVALRRGPVVLAANSAGLIDTPLNPLEEAVECGDEDPLSVATRPGALALYPSRRLHFKPLYDFALGETYFLYNRARTETAARSK